MSYKKEKEYICGWCQYIFKAIAGVTGGSHNQRGIKARCGSNTITCPKCGNNLKTWNEKEERELLMISGGK